MENHYDYLIVGSGLYGATFAHLARKQGKKCLVIDKRDHLGGNIYCENIEGINVHKYGAHIFHTNNKKVWNYITRFAEFNRFTNSPVANYRGELYSLPFNMYTFNKMWGVVTPEEAAAQILNVLFSVPQISVRMRQLPETHRRMLTFWLGFWRENRPALMSGRFQPELPQWNYPLVSAEDCRSRITVLYSPGLTVPVALHSGQAFRLVNASGSSRVTVEWNGVPRKACCFNTLGEPVGCIRLESGIQVIDIPVSGLLQVRAGSER